MIWKKIWNFIQNKKLNFVSWRKSRQMFIILINNHKLVISNLLLFIKIINICRVFSFWSENKIWNFLRNKKLVFVFWLNTNYWEISLKLKIVYCKIYLWLWSSVIKVPDERPKRVAVCCKYFNVLRLTTYCGCIPTDWPFNVMHQQFYIQQLYVLPTLYLCLYLSENKQRLVPLTA